MQKTRYVLLERLINSAEWWIYKACGGTGIDSPLTKPSQKRILARLLQERCCLLRLFHLVSDQGCSD